MLNDLYMINPLYCFNIYTWGVILKFSFFASWQVPEGTRGGQKTFLHIDQYKEANIIDVPKIF